MTRSSFLCVLLIALIAPAASPASELPMKVGVAELFKHPKKYHGKQVEVVGYWVTSCAHCSDLYPSFEEEQRKPYGTFVSLGDLRQASMPRSFGKMLEKSWGDYDGFVRVIGTFRFTPIPDWVGKPVKPQPSAIPYSNQRSSGGDEVERVIVWGWNGPPVKQIVSITLFQPIGPAIPSHIEKYDEEQVRKGLEETERLRRAGKLPPLAVAVIPFSNLRQTA
jgi:hypothetical protein